MGKWYRALDKADADAFKRSIISGAIYRFTTAYIFQCFLLQHFFCFFVHILSYSKALHSFMFSHRKQLVAESNVLYDSFRKLQSNFYFHCRCSNNRILHDEENHVCSKQRMSSDIEIHSEFLPRDAL